MMEKTPTQFEFNTHFSSFLQFCRCVARARVPHSTSDHCKLVILSLFILEFVSFIGMSALLPFRMMYGFFKHIISIFDNTVIVTRRSE